jgi:hypothetical protein
MLDRMAQSEESASVKRSLRQQAELNREREIEQSIQRSQQEKLIKQQIQDQEERLAQELEKYKVKILSSLFYFF